MQLSQNLLRAGMAGLVAAYFGLWLLAYYDHAGALVDDAYISFRYARHLAEGLGLTFNPGLRVEGFSNPLWVFTLAAGARAGVAPHDLAPVLGLMLGVLALAGLALTARRRDHSVLMSAVLLGGLAVDAGFVVWAGSGLETAGAATMAAWILALTARLVPGRWQEGLWLGLAASGWALLRPEGALLWMVTGAWLVWGAWVRDSVLWGYTVGSLPWAGYLIFRRSYFGEWFPNTFFAKVEPGFRGWSHAWESLGAWLAAHAVVGLAVLWAVRRRRRSAPAGPRYPAAYLWLPAAWIVTQVAFVLVVGGDWMGHSRYLVPVLPAVYLLAAEALRGFRWSRAAVVAVTVGLVLHAGAGWFTRDRIPTYTRQGQPLGEWLRSVAAPTDVLAVTAAGAIPYFSGLTTYDVLGLNDPGVAGWPVQSAGGWTPGHRRYDLDAMLSAEPDWVVWDFSVKVNRYRMRQLKQAPVDPRGLSYRRSLLARPEFQKHYEIDYSAPAATQQTYTVYRRRRAAPAVPG